MSSNTRITVSRSFSDMSALTACVWIKSEKSGYQSMVSYAYSNSDSNELLIGHHGNNGLYDIRIRNHPLSSSNMALDDGIWHHICTTWLSSNGKWKFYHNGVLDNEETGVKVGQKIRGGGVLILGQEQDKLGGSLNPSQALIGSLSEFNMWSTVLSNADIGRIKLDCSIDGDVFKWTIADLDIAGDVSTVSDHVCDVEIPSIECPSDVEVIIGAVKSVETVDWQPPTVTDNSDTLTVTTNHEPGSDFPVGETMVTYSVVDPSSNHASCSFNITVQDIQNPHIICPPDTNVTTSLRNRTTQVIWPMPNASDNSGIVHVLGSHKPGDNFNIGVTAVHYEASDPSGNTASCSFTVTVKDIENPQILCPPDTNVTTSLGNPTTQVIWPMANASDNSGIVHLLGSHKPGDNFNIGVTAVHYEASDPSGNTASCSFIVTVKDIENPHIICPPDTNVTTSLGNPTIKVIWSIPNSSDNSGIVHVLGSHKPGDNFNIGVTAVHYEASDLSGNTASCSFTVTVKAVVKPSSVILNRTKVDISMKDVTEGFSNYSKMINGLGNFNISQQERQALASDVLQAMDTDIAALHSSAEVNDESLIEENVLIETIMNTTDDLSKFILKNIEPGSGPVVLDTPSIKVALESDSLDRLANRSIAMGDGNGFSLPAADKLFSNLAQGEGTLNMIVKCLKRKSVQADDAKDIVSEFDILSLSFTDRANKEIQVTGTKEDIRMTFTSDTHANDSHVKLESFYSGTDHLTHFATMFEVSQLFHAIIITLQNSEPMQGKSVAFVFNSIVEYSHDYRGYQFSVDVEFNGNNSKIFIPEDYIMRTGKYFLTFSVPEKKTVKFSMIVKQTSCTYLNKSKGTWQRDGCKASSVSTLMSTVCLCNHLTIFTVPSSF
ncbi:polycystin-1-like protein 3 [Ptychodera flava]|uniref:polycystin-1-like protein 3 n=1 Tax=Ptychodera flava TaxID=63121 RepID=UPI00396A7288